MYAYDCLNVSPDDASDSTFGSIDNDEYDGRDVVDFTWQQVGNVFSVVSYQGEPVRFDYKYSKEKGTLVSNIFRQKRHILLYRVYNPDSSSEK